MSATSPDSGGGVRFGRPRDWLIGGVLLAAVITGVGLTVGWGPLLAPWRELRPSELAALLALSTASYVLRAVRVYDWFRPAFAGCFPTVLRLSVLHNTANNLLPMRAGEMVFPWLMGRYFGHGFMGATATLVWIRLLDLHFLGLIGFFILYLRDPAWPWPAAAVAWLGLLPVLALLRRLAPAGEGRLRRLVRLVAEATPASGGLVARVYAWTALVWITKFIAFATLLAHFLPIEPWQILLGVMGAELSSVLPFHGIAGSGSYEVAMVAALVPVGVSAEAAFAGAVNLHIFLLGVTILLGLLALLLPVRRMGGELAANERK